MKDIWVNPKNFDEVEEALDKRQLFIEVKYNTWVYLRRSGPTQLAKKQKGKFRIPVVYGKNKIKLQITEVSDLTQYRIADTSYDAARK